MAEHHIHVHIHGSQPDNNEVALQALASAGKQAASQNEVSENRQAAAPSDVQYTTAAVAILVGAIIGRKKGETSKETAVEIAKDIVDLILETDLAGAYLIAAAHVAAGYLMHGSGHYKKSTIAERAVDAVNLI